MITNRKLLMIAIIGLFAITISKFDYDQVFTSEPGIVEGVNQQSLEVTVFDVGQGDSIFIETPDEFQILIDGGDNSMVLDKLNDKMDFNDRYIDLVILTHPHADHVSGLTEVLKRYEVGQVWLTGVIHTSSAYLEFLDLIKEKNIEARTAFAGMDYKLDNIDLTVLYPLEDISGTSMKNMNNSSVVVKLTDNMNSFLFMGDAEIEDEIKMMEIFDENELKADVLKIGHHGSSDSSSEEFLKIVNPEIAVISVGEGNIYGHPSLRTIRRLERLETQILRTDKDGDIGFVVNENLIEIVD